MTARSIITIGGETKVIAHWWGISLFLSSDAVKRAALGEVAGIAALIALIPGAGWSVAAAIAGAVAGDWVAGQSCMPCVVQLSWDSVISMRYGVTYFILPQDSSIDYDYFLGA